MFGTNGLRMSRNWTGALPLSLNFLTSDTTENKREQEEQTKQTEVVTDPLEPNLVMSGKVNMNDNCSGASQHLLYT